MGKVSVWKIVIKVIIAMATTLLGALGTKERIMTRKTKQTFLLLLRILGTIIGIVLGAVSCTLWF